MNTNDQILQVESLTKVYGKGDNKTDALRGITFNVQKGEFLGIMGASGSGKTTLLNCNCYHAEAYIRKDYFARKRYL